MGFDLPRKSKGNLWAVSMICLNIYIYIYIYIQYISLSQKSQNLSGLSVANISMVDVLWLLKPCWNHQPMVFLWQLTEFSSWLQTVVDVGSIKQIELDIGIEPAAILILLSSRWLHCQLYKHGKTSKLWLVGKCSFWCPNPHQKNILSLSFTKVPPDYWVISANFWELLRGPLPHQAEVSLPNTLFIIAFPLVNI